ncbi:Selenocysteine-specific elongation factor [Sulfitobacter pontiacus]|jgi:selenocysteine-specific elongation factor|uniref:Selenocysteine-specific elongation factor n=1 Tax=Sulfitobacter pontiacus TaxID=60137 RepID=A0AAX3A848_9RHOB|nr:selenocysteine-specific translation elongation factor [Sulfitobacter pontiacus]UOA22367.1 Selenocysteine-specific elongation factor [Sulfitobacter pontiacus]WPZ26136.1 selenocysteine-specific translation elongation factor [Sulfitobacter pontiacus]
MTSACVIVIGHVDHGKTALVRALTGMETDRLAEEKARGLSIALGFAHCEMAGGTLDLIDAPGHEDFIRTMVSGASGAQGAMLVVSAVEGIAAQTREHVQIARLLQVPVAVVAVTKVDLIPVATLPARLVEIEDALAAQGVTVAELVPCSATTAGGTDHLRQVLARRFNALPARAAPMGAFLPVDRAFTLAGRGTVVTGTLLGGALAVGEALTVQPSGAATVVRGLQARGAARERVAAGERVAVNLRGIALEDIARGDVICTGGQGATLCMDVWLTVSDMAPRPVKHMQDLRVLWGTAHEVATLRLMGGGQIAPGGAGFGQLRFKRPVVGFAGQAAVLRQLSPVATLAGAVILDPQATAVGAGDRRRLAVMQAAQQQDGTALAAALCAQGRGVALWSDLVRLARCDATAALPTGVVRLSPEHIALADDLAAVQTAVVATLQRFHTDHPIKQGAALSMLQRVTPLRGLVPFAQAELVRGGEVVVRDGLVSLARHDPFPALAPQQLARLTEIEERMRAGGTSPPDVRQFDAPDDADLIALLVAQGRLVSLANIALKQQVVFHAATIGQAQRSLAASFPPPTAFTTSAARTALGTTRKFIVPLLEHLDALGMTLRDGDTRQIAPQAH